MKSLLNAIFKMQIKFGIYEIFAKQCDFVMSDAKYAAQ